MLSGSEVTLEVKHEAVGKPVIPALGSRLCGNDEEEIPTPSYRTGRNVEALQTQWRNL